MGNVIQIKRGSGQPGAGILADGELGYDTSGGFLYIGVDGASVKIKAEGSGGSSGTISGILSLAQGGTGADLSTTDTATNSIIIKGSSTALSSVAPKAGAFYCTGVSEVPKYGTLPLSIGGTGADLRDAKPYAVIVRDPAENSNKLTYIDPPVDRSGILVYDYSSNPKAAKFISSLPLALGGTGANLSGTNVTANSVIIKGSSSALSSIAPPSDRSGILVYDFSSDPKATKFISTLPVTLGGTGANAKPGARVNLGICELLFNSGISSNATSASIDISQYTIIAIQPNIGAWTKKAQPYIYIKSIFKDDTAYNFNFDYTNSSGSGIATLQVTKADENITIKNTHTSNVTVRVYGIG